MMKHPLPSGGSAFDAFARHYREMHDANIRLSGAGSAYFARLKIQILACYESDQAQQVLDLGCGDGLCAAYMHEQFPSWQITGVDVSAESLAVARERKLPGIQFLHYDGEHLPFASQQFDVIFLAGVLHHVQQSQHLPLVREIRRVSRKQGRIYIFEHNPFNPLTRYFVHTCAFDKGVRLLKLAYVRHLLDAAGWEAQTCRYYIFWPRYSVFRPLLSLESWLAHVPLGGQYMVQAQAR